MDSRSWRALALAVLAFAGVNATKQRAAVVWSTSVSQTGRLDVYSDDSYQLFMLNRATGNYDPWLSSAPTMVYVGGIWYSAAASPTAPVQPLQRVAAGNGTNGTYVIQYLAGITPVVTEFLPADGSGNGLVGFRLSLPAGAAGVNITVPVNSSATSTTSLPRARDPQLVRGEFSSSVTPATAFPVFVQAQGSVASAQLGYVSWASRFFQPLYKGSGGAAAAFDATAIGAEGGPIVLFDGAAATSGPIRTAAVLSAFDHFKSVQIGPAYGVNGSAAVGINGYVTSLPAGFAVSSGLVLGLGITDTVHTWGQALAASVAAPPKLPDPASTQLSYWTDNGAFYDFYAYEPNITSAGVPEEILIAVADTLRNGSYAGPPIPAKLLMLDAYWMYNTRSNGNCKMNDTVWPIPLPKGLTYLSQQAGMGLTIYNGPQCGNSTYSDKWPLISSLYWDQGWGKGTLSAIADGAAYPFYQSLMADLTSQAMVTFTQDFLDFQSLLFPDWLTSPEGNAHWLAAQAQAAFEAGVPLQYCMGLPSDMLQSVRHPAVTNARASNDYGAGGDNWKIAGSSLLLSALGLRASKDNFWTSAPEGHPSRGGETSPYLVAIVAALSGGPVGFADALFATDPAVLWPTCSLNGTLLHPSRPATAVDAQYLGTESGLPLAAGDVRATHSAIQSDGSGQQPQLYYYSVLAVGLTVNLPSALTSADLWPAPPSDVTYWAWAWNTSACATNGSAVSDCAAVLGSGVAPGTAPAPPPDRQQWQLVHTVPVLSNGWVLLGETAKYVSISPDRFARVSPAPPGFDGIFVQLLGAPSEAVSVAYVPAAGIVKVASLILGADGRLSALLQ